MGSSIMGLQAAMLLLGAELPFPRAAQAVLRPRTLLAKLLRSRCWVVLLLVVLCW